MPKGTLSLFVKLSVLRVMFICVDIDTIPIYVLYQIAAFFSTFLPYNFLILHFFCSAFLGFKATDRQNKQLVSTKHAKTCHSFRE